MSLQLSARSILLACMIAAAPVALANAGDEPPSAAKEATGTLTIGDNAPQLAIEKWVRGDPVTGFEKGKVYIIEFWATWCGPCIKAIPHLTELSKKHAAEGLVVIGVTSKDPNNPLDKVEKLVAKQNEKGQMTYTVAWDGTRATGNAYMRAAKRDGIPCSFVIDKNGKVAFIGHPMELDEVLPKVLNGSWDLAAAKTKYENAHLFEEKMNEFAEAMFKGEHKKASEVGKQLVDKYAADDAMALNYIAWSIVDPDAEIEDSKRDIGLALAASEKAAKLTNNEDAPILDTLARCYFMKGDAAKAIEIQTQALAGKFPEGMEPEDLQEMKDGMKASLEEYRKAKK